MTGGDQESGRRLPAGTHLAGFSVPASATGVLVIDLDALLRNYAQAARARGAGRMRRRRQGRRLWAGRDAGRRRRFSPPAAGPSSWRRSPRLSALRGAVPDAGDLCARRAVSRQRRGFRGAAAPAGARQHGRDRGMGGVLPRQRQAQLPAAIHIDTGMNRLGLKAGRASRRWRASRTLLKAFPVSLLMSHLACADTPDHPKNAAQRADFAAFAGRTPADAPQPRQFGGRASRRRIPLRSRAPRHRALWRQPVFRPAQSDGAGRPPLWPHRADRRGGARGNHRLWRPARASRAAPATSPSSTGYADGYFRAARLRRTRMRARSPISAIAPCPYLAAFPWILSCSTSPTSRPAWRSAGDSSN